MYGQARRFATIAALIILVVAPLAIPQSMDDRIRSEHVQLRIARERELLGRDSIMDLERCWRFMNGATDGNLPRRVLVVIDWSRAATLTSYQESSITIGMNQPAAAADTKGYLFHTCARELARLGLYGISRGATVEEGTEFLAEGMAEILVHEYERNSRSLEAAWVVSGELDRMNLLGFNAQRAWVAFSGGRHDLRAASPGITLLDTCRELYGRDKLIKLFESLRKVSFRESLVTVFRTNLDALEREWLNRVRNHHDVGDVIVASSEDAPKLLKTIAEPEACKAGSSLQMRLFFKDGSNDLSPWGVFLKDEASGKVVQAQAAPGNQSDYVVAVIAVEAGRKPGQYGFRITAVDEIGNVCNWDGKYSVVP